MEFPADAKIIVVQSYFIKTVEDLYEAVKHNRAASQVRIGLQRELWSLLDAGRRKGGRASRYGHSQLPGIGLCARSHPECVPHQRLECDPKCARGVLHLLGDG